MSLSSMVVILVPITIYSDRIIILLRAQRARLAEGEGPGQTNTDWSHANAISKIFNCRIFLASHILFVQNLDIVYRIIDTT
jgi:hypothetical protein